MGGGAFEVDEPLGWVGIVGLHQPVDLTEIDRVQLAEERSQLDRGPSGRRTSQQRSTGQEWVRQYFEIWIGEERGRDRDLGGMGRDHSEKPGLGVDFAIDGDADEHVAGSIGDVVQPIAGRDQWFFREVGQVFPKGLFGPILRGWHTASFSGSAEESTIAHEQVEGGFQGEDDSWLRIGDGGVTERGAAR
ncbi:hypothetical protein GCM10009789_29110 [Kribbella sancticallisti]|uniref:Uncharacterized protein n=1 Tax=Kribbella sancticallisti TaxID=460087 RepID=A0ABN2DDV1_9ACTN